MRGESHTVNRYLKRSILTSGARDDGRFGLVFFQDT
jgi:hypothetical protein